MHFEIWIHCMILWDVQIISLYEKKKTHKDILVIQNALADKSMFHIEDEI